MATGIGLTKNNLNTPTGKNGLLIEYFNEIESLLSTIDLNIKDDNSPSEIKKVFVSVPTSISIDVTVENRKIKSVIEDEKVYDVESDNNKYKDCIERFNDLILPNSNGKENERFLILRPYWKDGLIKKFLCLKPIDVIATNQYTIVLGGPGSGKSTLLKHLSILLAKQYYNSNNLLYDDAYSEFFYKNRYIPVFLQLRRFFNDALIKGNPIGNINQESLLKFLFQDRKDQFEELLKSQNVIFFFDGIDEIFTNNTCQIIQRLVDVVKEINENAKIVFSSRKESYSTWELDEFTSFELLPMDSDCRCLLAGKVLKTYHVCDFDNKLNSLIDRISACGLDEQIVGNPLFLSLMVVVYVVTGDLPEKKSLMLKESIRFLIKRWQTKISQENKSNIYELEQLYSALKEIAYSTLINDNGDNPLIIKEEQIFVALENLVSQSAIAAYIPAANTAEKRESLLKCLVESVGVIIPSQQARQFEFAHRHFQEYLIASKLVEKTNLPNALMDMIIHNKVSQNEVYFMIIDILFDREDYSMIWGILQCLVNSDEDDFCGGDEELNGWILWFCCKVISARNYALLKTTYDNRFSRVKDTLLRVNARANNLIANSNILSMKKRVACARYLGEIREKLELEYLKDQTKDYIKNYIKSFVFELGDKRIGVSLNSDGLPDIAWCNIESGSFVMGISESDAQLIAQEHPNSDFSREQPCVALDIKEFDISKYPITIAQYQAFVDAGAYEDASFWDWSNVSKEWFEAIGSKKKYVKPNVSNAPIVDIAWIEAAGFCIWLSKVTHSKIRIPFESEWEYVAKLHYNMYSYSDDYDTEKYISRKLSMCKAAPVGIYVSKIDGYPSDLTGNVWEWTQTLIPYDAETLKGYADQVGKRNIILPTTLINRDSRMVAKGGSFLNMSFQARNSYRGRDYIWNHVTTRQSFRVVREK